MIPTLVHRPPRLKYNGITIILSEPSRFDLKRNELLSGLSGLWFKEECLRPETNIFCCDLRTLECEEPFFPETKVLFLLGEKAFKAHSLLTDYSLDNQRGCPLKTKFPDIKAVASYTPQDACDIKNWELEYNPLKLDEKINASIERDKDED